MQILYIIDQWWCCMGEGEIYRERSKWYKYAHVFVRLFDLKRRCALIKKDTKVGTRAIQKHKESSALLSIALMNVTQRPTCTVQTAKTWIFRQYRNPGMDTSRKNDPYGHPSLLVLIKHIFCMTIFYITYHTQYLHFTTTLLTINKHQIRIVLRQKSELMVC